MNVQVKAMIDEGMATAADFEPASTVDAFDTEIERKVLDDTIAAAKQRKAEIDREIDALEEEMAILRQKKNAAITRWHDHHVSHVRAQRRQTELTEQESR